MWKWTPFAAALLLAGCAGWEKAAAVGDQAAPALSALGSLIPPPFGTILATIGGIWTTVRGGHAIQYGVEAVKAAPPGQIVGRPEAVPAP
jgi:hypothetical protein